MFELKYRWNFHNKTLLSHRFIEGPYLEVSTKWIMRWYEDIGWLTSHQSFNHNQHLWHSGTVLITYT